MERRLTKETHYTKIDEELREVLEILRFFYKEQGFNASFELRVSSHALLRKLQVGRVRTDQFNLETQEIWVQITKGLKQFKNLKITQRGEKGD
jgi:threonyl-tRNA synthetase